MTTFRFERQLFDVLHASSSSAVADPISQRHYRLLEHPQVGGRIPDLVMMFSRVDALRPLRLTYFEAALVSTLLRLGEATAIRIAEHLFAPLSAIGAAVHRLVGLRVLKRRRSGDTEVYRVSERALPRDAEVVAVEAKLRRWRVALEQATAYLEFANRAFVAMPSDTARRNTAMLEACAERGVGVIAVDAACAATVLEAVRRPTKSPDWLRLVSAHLGIVRDPARTDGTPPPNFPGAAARSLG